MDTYHQLARQKFRYGPITGSGPWACVRRCPAAFKRRWRISLHATTELAERAARRECKHGCLGTWNHFVSCVIEQAAISRPVAETPNIPGGKKEAQSQWLTF